MCLIMFLCAYLVNSLRALKLNNSLGKGVNVMIGNRKILKRQRVNNLGMLRNTVNFFFWKKKYHERPISEKLNIVPVFILTNHNNSPYIFHENDTQVCYLFLCPYDAENALNEIVKNNGIKNKNNVKIHNISMEKAYELVREYLFLKNMEKRNEDGRKNNVYWKLIPSKRQMENALIFLPYKKKSTLLFPVFYIEGFYIRKDTKNIIPLFFDMEDLKEAIEKTPMKNYEIKVLNFIDVIFSDNHSSFGFIPSAKSLAYMEKLKKIGVRKSYF
ncbi:apicoplast TIC22 protein, putative [Plasmodium ovale]|uniref:Apicoplast TIC22 protein, putative n=1 Tax=Plasmodium ovale TaxID=36330 RepID=A0A1D3U8D5_PLAOA|nr:apicoplast TIC22 protein, putative [Plasmodium ovale]